MKLVYIVIGVSGSGKSTIGKMLASQMNLPFHDADSFHPSANIKKMSDGIPLEDTDRWPWLNAIGEAIHRWNLGDGAVLACSALKESYRRRLAKNNLVKWIVLEGDEQVIRSRMEAREDHYMQAGMLGSQISVWESPSYGIKPNLDHSPKEIVTEINSQLNMSDIGVIGLGTMGANLAKNLIRNSVSTAVYNRHVPEEESIVEQFISEQPSGMVTGSYSLEDFVNYLSSPRKIIIMIPAGNPTDKLLDKLLPLLDKGDIVIDGGNVHYNKSAERAKLLENNGFDYLGCGISGGSYGALNGPSMMVGGNRAVYSKVNQILEMISSKDDQGSPCVAYLGPQGSGHYVKMLHNGIEYAEMQLLAEIFAILGNQHSNTEISKLFKEWNSGDLQSYLLEITSEILVFESGDAYILDQIHDVAASKGTGTWTVISGLELGVSTSMVHAAVEARAVSMRKKKRVEFSRKFNDSVKSISIDPGTLKKAYRAARLINHHQGFEMLKAASTEYKWRLELSEIARIWTAGCILQSELMKKLTVIFGNESSILGSDDFGEDLLAGISALNSILDKTSENGIATPCLSAALQFWNGMTTANSPANLIQAQRDYFGSHGYRLAQDPEGKSHTTNWKQDG